MCVCVFTILNLQREFMRPNSRRTDKERVLGRQRVSQKQKQKGRCVNLHCTRNSRVAVAERSFIMTSMSGETASRFQGVKSLGSGGPAGSLVHLAIDHGSGDKMVVIKYIRRWVSWEICL